MELSEIRKRKKALRKQFTETQKRARDYERAAAAQRDELIRLQGSWRTLEELEKELQNKK